MRVALCAAHRQPHPDLRGGIGAVFHGSDAKLLVVGAALRVGHRVAMKPGGDPGLFGRLREQVAGDLLDREPVVRQVAVQSVDDPIAPRPDVQAERVGAVTGRIGIARQVEPDAGPAFSVGGRVEQMINQPFVRIALTVVHERIHLLGRGRQAGQIQ